MLANAGGVVIFLLGIEQQTSSASSKSARSTTSLTREMRSAYREVEQRATRGGVSLRVAAYELAIEQVLEATRLRGYGGYA